MKRSYKISAILLSVLMIVSMTAIFANAAASAVTYNTTANTITVKKQLNTLDEGDMAYNEPNFTYSYSLAPVTGGATVTDGTNTVTTKTGPAGLVTLNTTSLTFDTAHADGVAAQNIKDIGLTVDPSVLTDPKAGVYRYALTETATGLAAAKINRDANYDSELILDVYINTAGEFVGASLIKNDTNVDTSTDKITGWSDTSVTPDGTVSDLVDSFKTYDLTIGKTITGSAADMTHEFPFSAAVAGNTVNFYAAKAATTVGAASDTTGTQTTALGNGQTYTISGLTADTTVLVTETNDTADTYKVTATNDGTAYVTAQAVAPAGTQDNAASATAVATYGATANTDGLGTVAYTNNLDTVSPTGLVLRFAPFVLMAVVACAIVVVSRRNKENESTDRI